MITLEEVINRDTAEQIYGTLKRWNAVPLEAKEIDLITGKEGLTLFGTSRLEDAAKKVIVHRVLDKENNRFNIFLNGVMMLPSKTPMKLFYPRGNYPITNIPAERLTGSIYARSIPAKTKFNADYVDWLLKMAAVKFEQGAFPALLAKGNYTLSRDMFRGGQITHGVSKADFEKADPDNRGITQSEFGFVQFFKQIVEAQTLNPTSSGELSSDATATEIAITDQNQRDKLAYLLDGIAGGFMDMAYRRAETIESKYTIKQKETTVDGQKINVYQNFTVNIAGINHAVVLDDRLGDLQEGSADHEDRKYELFQQAFDTKKTEAPTEFYLADPMRLRRGKHIVDIEIFPERIKETELQMQMLWNEFAMLLKVFGRSVDVEEMKALYLETSGRPGELFKSAEAMRLEDMQAAAQSAPETEAPEQATSGPSLIQRKTTAAREGAGA